MGMSERPQISLFGVRPTRENANRVIEALRAFGAPLHDLTEKDLSTPSLVFQIGVDPIRIDVLTAIDGVGFEEAWADQMSSKFADQPVAVLSREHLIKNKLAAARTQDLADVEALKRKERKQS
jgi:citrate lyase alpha subunit